MRKVNIDLTLILIYFSDMGRTTEVMLFSMVWSKGSISLNGPIRKPIKPSSTAADVPDAL